MIKYGLLFGSVTMTVIASTLLKIGGKGINYEGSLMNIALSYFTSPAIVAGFATYALAAVLWVYCLSIFDLSYVTFVSSVQYILLVAVSIFIFNEQISLLKWTGCAFIMIGVLCWLKG
jgi:drug/metabolite transporter (DMT)-like permease